MDISEVCALSGLPVSTIRYYEEKGLIESIGRKGLRRQFKASVVEELALISLGCRAGFTLSEIKSIFTPKGPNIDREMLKQKAQDLDHQIKTLITMRDGLLHAAACKAPNHFECTKFKRILNVQKKRPFRAGNKLK